MSALRAVLADARPLRRRFLLATALAAGTLAAGAGLLANSGYLISKAATQPEILSLGVAIVGVRFFALARAALRYLERVVSHDASFRFLARVRVRFFRRLEPLVPGETGSGDLLSRFVADVDQLQHVLVRVISPPVAAVAVADAAVVAAFFVSPQAAVALAASLVIGAVAVPFAVVRLGRAAARRRPAQRALVADAVVDLLGALPELIAYGEAGDRLDRIAAADRALRRSTARRSLATGAGDGALLALGGVAAVVVVAAALGHARGVMLGLLALLTLGVFEGIRALPLAADHLVAAETAAERVTELTSRAPAVADPPVPVRPYGSVLRAEAAGMRYTRPIDLELRPGSRIALLGPSGCGKTTLAHLLVRFLDPDYGRVTLGGVDVRGVAQDDLRSRVVLCGQDAHLFATSIRENVRLGKPGASDDEVLAALDRARIGAWVRRLPEGLDTDVGDEGGLVSGGERRRIALARAFLSGAPLLILDEPTAHLDDDTAAALLDDLLDAAGDTGILLITHSPLRLERFDQLILLEDGEPAVR